MTSLSAFCPFAVSEARRILFSLFDRGTVLRLRFIIHRMRSLRGHTLAGAGTRIKFESLWQAKKTPVRCLFCLAEKEGFKNASHSSCSVTESQGFQYPPSHHSLIKQSTGLFYLTVRAHSGFESLLAIQKAP